MVAVLVRRTGEIGDRRGRQGVPRQDLAAPPLHEDRSGGEAGRFVGRRGPFRALVAPSALAALSALAAVFIAASSRPGRPWRR
ncbi:hypothetical protein ABT330_22615 [Streptomyces sp. NPDC000658]|uniref:hypothetical protein n=1 Tax=Streptomyces sp. NPDC000658 TaxID=3154266 RepID=UPI00331CF92B